ncbi:MAG TPA: hypothetical protein VEJ86_00395 [Candidatus Binataceae bacterium]|nr:hypothetical protein [Candidatus Binataceae bacterium]
MESSGQATFTGTAIVVAYEFATLAHGAAHARLGIEVSATQNLFIWPVMIVIPLLSMALLWTSRQRAGLWLLALSMAAAFPFDLYFHFAVSGPDNALQQGPGQWPATFVTTAFLLQALTVAGVLASVWFLRRGPVQVKSVTS